MKRPLIVTSLLLWLGYCFADIVLLRQPERMSAAAFILLGLALAGGAIFPLVFKNVKAYKYGLSKFIFTCFVIALALVFYSLRVAEMSIPRSESQIAVTGTVERVEKYNMTMRSKAYGRLLVPVSAAMGANVSRGDVIIVEGRLRSFEGQRNPGDFSKFRHYGSKGLNFEIIPSCVESVSAAPEETLFAPVALRRFIEQGIAAQFRGDNAALAQALLLGDTDQMESDDLSAFRVSGLAHMLAVSGLHFGILYMAVWKVLESAGASYRGAVTASAVVLLVFLSLTSASFSAFRAFVMICLHVLSVLMKRRYDLLSALGAAAITALLSNPMVVWSAGFQLSFWALFGVAFYKIAEPCIFRSESSTAVLLAGRFAFPLALQVFTAPILGSLFNWFHPYGVIFNVPAAVMITPVFILSAAAVLMNRLPVVGQALAFMSGTFLDIIQDWARLADVLPFSSIPVASLPEFTLVFAYGALAVLTLSQTLRVWILERAEEIKANIASYAVPVFLLLGGLLLIMPIQHHQAGIDFLDVGQGDAILIHGQAGGHALIDGGPSRTRLSELILKQGVRHLDMVFMSHPDSDHANGFMSLEDRVGIGTFFYADNDDKPEVLQQLKEKFPETDFVRLQRGDVLDWEGYRMTVLHPDSREPVRDANNLSLAMIVEFEDSSLFLSGDIEDRAEERILNRALQSRTDLNVDILKVGHHGSKTSTTDAFVRALSPDFAVISVGKNRYGHPDEMTLMRLAENELDIFRTDMGGCIRITFRGGHIQITPWLERKR